MLAADRRPEETTQVALDLLIPRSVRYAGFPRPRVGVDANAHEPRPRLEQLATDGPQSRGRLPSVARDLRVRLDHRLEHLPDHLAFVGIGLLGNLFAALEQAPVGVQKKQFFLHPERERWGHPEVVVVRASSAVTRNRDGAPLLSPTPRPDPACRS